MSSPDALRVEIDGQAATADGLRVAALVSYGHYTAMQVRGGRVRGLDLHLSRLDGANRELFGAGLDPDLVRNRVRHALAGDDGRGDAGLVDASVRVTVFWPDAQDTASILVSVRPPVAPPTAPVSLKSVPYQRPLAHLKHVGTFGQIHYGRVAARAGFDDALLTGPDGVISEAAIANVGFFDGVGIVWPVAPMLPGTTMGLLEARLDDSALPSRRAVVRLADVPSFAAAFVANSHGVGALTRVDDVRLPVDDALIATLTDTYESAPLDHI